MLGTRELVKYVKNNAPKSSPKKERISRQVEKKPGTQLYTYNTVGKNPEGKISSYYYYWSPLRLGPWAAFVFSLFFVVDSNFLN